MRQWILDRLKNLLYWQDRFPMPFIVGVARSGTTLLRMMLDAHPHMGIPPETGFLPVVATLTSTGGTLREEFFERVTTFPTWDDFQIDRHDFHYELEAIEKFTIAAGLRCFYRNYAKARGKVRYGDKTPTYCQYMLSIQKLLPEARFIHIIRDGRDVALSLRGLWFSPGDDLETLARHWCEQIEIARDQGRSCRYHEIRYEDLLERPRDVLMDVCQFLELPYHPAIERYFEKASDHAHELRTRYNADGSVLISNEDLFKQHHRVGRPPDQSRVGRWREEMTPQEVTRFEIVAGPRLRELGYEIAGERRRTA